MDFLKAYLLLGLLLHKALWEVMKRRQHTSMDKTISGQSIRLSLLKAVKIGVLVAIVVQVLSPPIFPISAQPSVTRGLGILFYTCGLILAVVGRVQLGDNWLDIEEAAVKRNQSVVSAGIYKYIRHPIYVGDLLLLLGLELALNSWLLVPVFLAAPGVLYQAIREERVLCKKLAGYDLYCRSTKRFIPFVT